MLALKSLRSRGFSN